MNEITYNVYICMDCKVEVEKEYFEIPLLRDTHRTIRFTVDADTNTIVHHEKAKDYKEPEIRDDTRIWMHKKYKKEGVDKKLAIPCMGDILK